MIQMVRDLPPGALAWCAFTNPRRFVIVLAYVWSEHGNRLIQVFDSGYEEKIRTFHPDYIVPLDDDVKLHRIDMIMNEMQTR